MVVQEDQYKIGYYSLFDDRADIVFEVFENDISQLPDTWAVNRLKWFTKGFYGVRQVDGKTIMSDLRMGMEPDQYTFQFIVSNDPVTQYRQNPDMSRIDALWGSYGA